MLTPRACFLNNISLSHSFVAGEGEESGAVHGCAPFITTPLFQFELSAAIRQNPNLLINTISIP